MSLRTSWRFLLHPASSAEASVGAMDCRMWPIAAGGIVTGTSSALENAFPEIKGHIVGQQPAGNPVPASRDSHGSCVSPSLQSEGGFYYKLTGQIRSPVTGNFLTGDLQKVT